MDVLGCPGGEIRHRTCAFADAASTVFSDVADATQSSNPNSRRRSGRGDSCRHPAGFQNSDLFWALSFFQRIKRNARLATNQPGGAGKLWLVYEPPATKLLRFNYDASRAVKQCRAEHEVIRRAHRAGVRVHPEIYLHGNVQAGQNGGGGLNHIVGRSR